MWAHELPDLPSPYQDSRAGFAYPRARNQRDAPRDVGSWLHRSANIVPVRSQALHRRTATPGLTTSRRMLRLFRHITADGNGPEFALQTTSGQAGSRPRLGSNLAISCRSICAFAWIAIAELVVANLLQRAGLDAGSFSYHISCVAAGPGPGPPAAPRSRLPRGRCPEPGLRPGRRTGMPRRSA
jgi:hypothetical protein